MSGFPSNPPNTSSGTTRRTSSSPYLGAALNRNRSQKGPSPQVPKVASTATTQTKNDRPGVGGVKPRPAPARGSRSAPPHPGIHEHLERVAGIQKEIKRKMIKSRLDRLIDYQEMINHEIDNLERDFERAMDSPPSRYRRAPPSEPEPEPKAKLKQFRVVGGCPGNLAYKINKKPGKDGKIRSFSLEVDVKGFSSENIEVDTDDATMTIKASKVNGSTRDLKVIAPTVKDMEKAYVHPPRYGLLVIDF